jgi:hypothetical protein
MKASQELLQELRTLEEKRKNGEIGPREFYKGLLKILSHLDQILEQEEISDNQIKKQIPLLLAFIKSQISELEARGH